MPVHELHFEKAVEEAGDAIELILGKVSRILYLMDTGVATGITYEPTGVKTTQAQTEKRNVTLKGDQIVLAVGPWTSKDSS